MSFFDIEKIIQGNNRKLFKYNNSIEEGIAEEFIISVMP